MLMARCLLQHYQKSRGYFMKRLLKFLIAVIIVLCVVSCEVGSHFESEVPDPSVPPGYDDPAPGPTTPIKRRPTVPKTKLPRPRVVDADILSNDECATYATQDISCEE